MWGSLKPLNISNGDIIWNQHCRGGHLIYNNKCFHCVHGALKGRQHRRVKDEDREMGVLAIDTAGLFQDGWATLGPGRP